jgi:peroxiredoxin|tara:strand:- start:279 stop:452 length:174 start_codon:yes stop_codon:yes gene_type:complete
MFAASINSLFSENVSLVEGDLSPHIELFDQDGKLFSSQNFIGEKIVVYFFPYADTPG